MKRYTLNTRNREETNLSLLGITELIELSEVELDDVSDLGVGQRHDIEVFITVTRTE